MDKCLIGCAHLVFGVSRPLPKCAASPKGMWERGLGVRGRLINRPSLLLSPFLETRNRKLATKKRTNGLPDVLLFKSVFCYAGRASGRTTNATARVQTAANMLLSFTFSFLLFPFAFPVLQQLQQHTPVPLLPKPPENRPVPATPRGRENGGKRNKSTFPLSYSRHPSPAGNGNRTCD
jgi:hypothetical protein